MTLTMLSGTSKMLLYDRKLLKKDEYLLWARMPYWDLWEALHLSMGYTVKGSGGDVGLTESEAEKIGDDYWRRMVTLIRALTMADSTLKCNFCK
jgi:hypothetical protein